MDGFESGLADVRIDVEEVVVVKIIHRQMLDGHVPSLIDGLILRIVKYFQVFVELNKLGDHILD